MARLGVVLSREGGIPEKGILCPKKMREAPTTIERLRVFATAYVTGWMRKRVQKASSLERYCMSPVHSSSIPSLAPLKAGGEEGSMEGPAPLSSITQARGASIRQEQRVSSA